MGPDRPHPRPLSRWARGVLCWVLVPRVGRLGDRPWASMRSPVGGLETLTGFWSLARTTDEHRCPRISSEQNPLLWFCEHHQKGGLSVFIGVTHQFVAE